MIQWKQWGKKSYRFIMNPIEQDARINILEGSVRSSKTVTMIPKWIEYIKRGPKGLLLMTGVTKETVYDNVLVDLLDTLGEKSYRYNRNSGELLVFWRDKVQVPGGYVWENGSRRIKIMGAGDEGSEKYIRGKTLAGAYCDELTLMPRSFFEQLLNRLSVAGAKLYATTNPGSPFHYLYTDYITSEEKLQNGMVKVWHFTLEDNPSLDEEYKNFIRNAYTGLYYDRMILGKWVLGSGRVYDMYSDSLLFENKDIPLGLRRLAERYIAIDYGTINPTVFLEIWDDGTTCWVMKEYYYDSRKEKGAMQKEDSQYADDLEVFVGKEQPVYVIVDPSAASFKVTLRNRGYRIKDADNAVDDGIRMVGSMLHRRLIRIHKDCKNMRSEFAAYSWNEKARERGDELVIKQHDHAMDALRYFVKTIIKPRRFAA